MLLSVHVTSVLFLARFDNFAQNTGFYWSYMLLLKSPVLVCSCMTFNVLLKNHFDPPSLLALQVSVIHTHLR